MMNGLTAWRQRIDPAHWQEKGRAWLAAQTGRLRWRTAYSIALLVVGMTLLSGIWMVLRVQAAHRTAVASNQVAQVTAAASDRLVVARWLAGPDALAPELTQISSLLDAQVTALDLDGHVWASSHSDEGANGGFDRLPEVRSALAGEIGQSRRRPAQGETWAFYVAAPVREGGARIGVLHMAFPTPALQRDLATLRNIIVVGLALLALATCGLVVVHTEYTAYGIRRMTSVVKRITAGDLDARIFSLGRGEIGDLARLFNGMADRLQRQMKKRARERNRLNTVMHVMTDGLIILNRRGEVKLINPAAAKLLNITEDKALNRTFVQTARDHRIAEVWTRCQQNGHEEVAAIEMESSQFLRVVVTPFLKRVGRGYLVMLQDLTQVRRLQIMRQDFISNVSHELRTPLASLRALVDTLRDGALDDPPAAGRFLDRMEVEVDALTQMVEELLELSRIESGQVPLRLNPVLPSAAILPAVDRLRAQAERNELALVLDVPRALPLVVVDASRIQQVITNLIHNAIKFTPKGGSITVSARQEGARVVAAVADTGVGISAQDLPRIFERFYKTDRSRAVGGTGLGLAIAKHIVQAHNGEVWAESVEGKGSTFYIALPIVADPDGPGASPLHEETRDLPVHAPNLTP